MNIYVGNLVSSITEERLKALFEPFGEIKSIKIIKDKFTGQARGFAFVEMMTSAEAQQAIDSLNGQELEGQRLKVNEARPKPATGGMGGGSRGPRSGGFGGRDSRGGGSSGPRFPRY
jgi:RNA recognition motif-containing protein